MKSPRQWKMAVVVWIAIYPTVTILAALFDDRLPKMTPLPVRTLVSTLIVVPLMVFVLMPLLQRFFAGWLKS